MLKRIHVNQHILKENKRTGLQRRPQNPPDPGDPPITVKTYKSNDKGHSVDIHGESTVVYRPDHPLPCGAVLWLETRAPVTVFLSYYDPCLPGCRWREVHIA